MHPGAAAVVVVTGAGQRQTDQVAVAAPCRRQLRLSREESVERAVVKVGAVFQKLRLLEQPAPNRARLDRRDRRIEENPHVKPVARLASLDVRLPVVRIAGIPKLLHLTPNCSGIEVAVVVVKVGRQEPALIVGIEHIHPKPLLAAQMGQQVVNVQRLEQIAGKAAVFIVPEITDQLAGLGLVILGHPAPLPGRPALESFALGVGEVKPTSGHIGATMNQLAQALGQAQK